MTFSDGVLICKYIYQSAIEKVLNGVIEEEQIFFKAYEMLEEIDDDFDHRRLEELLHLLNMENVYSVV